MKSKEVKEVGGSSPPWEAKNMKKKERQNLFNMIQLTIGVSMVSACVIAIIILGLFFLGSKLGI